MSGGPDWPQPLVSSPGDLAVGLLNESSRAFKCIDEKFALAILPTEKTKPMVAKLQTVTTKPIHHHPIIKICPRPIYLHLLFMKHVFGIVFYALGHQNSLSGDQRESSTKKSSKAKITLSNSTLAADSPNPETSIITTTPKKEELQNNYHTVNLDVTSNNSLSARAMERRKVDKEPATDSKLPSNQPVITKIRQSISFLPKPRTPAVQISKETS
ncbi:hypothetical protein M9H77_08211 [Catharanthus roseus]|uniref:Uncharacterized protein n=1 Tax=Catharanthus roseus TaxID=4058 RepID=A0ACC0BXH5_CATRO|nr:hypothetical protein M9H77_08211 [Catharanthus roseus]